ncbi:MAG: aminopeptidase P family protein [Leptospirales bacterium]|nr:aminopeptidase P family protein [Leptospirales bacterium]
MLNWFTRRRLQAHGKGFQLRGLLAARQQTRRCLQQIARSIAPGMLEAEAVAMAEALLQESGAERCWHPPQVRFGENTLLACGMRSAPDLRLDKEGIFFLDIAPVFDGFEGDAGDSFAVGENEEQRRCVRDVRRIFGEVRRHWLLGRISGRELYQLAAESARRRGWQLNLQVDGHRISMFPHHHHFRGSLGDIDFVPDSGAWVLEIQIRHPAAKFGAFYEDLLLDDEAAT